jgi:hypothetical protein
MLSRDLLAELLSMVLVVQHYVSPNQVPITREPRTSFSCAQRTAVVWPSCNRTKFALAEFRRNGSEFGKPLGIGCSK